MTRALLWAALAATLLLIPGEARAVYKCGDQKDDCKCGKNNPYPCCSNGGNCTWWAWEAACCNWKVGLPGWGNANQWAGNAKANSAYEVKKSPVAGSIGVRVSGSYGHVVWVTKVSGSTITVSEMNCWGNYGKRTKTYKASYFDGGYIVRKGSSCACTVGKTDTQPCGQCGKKTRKCGSNCKWGSWSACSGGGPCASGKTESKACARCGKQTRKCGSGCSWGSWGSCGGQGPCEAGKIEQQSCAGGGKKQRTCSSKCQWGAWGPCSKVDAGAVPADSAVGRDASRFGDAVVVGDVAIGGDLPAVAPGNGAALEGSCGIGLGGAEPWWGLVLLLVMWTRRLRRPWGGMGTSNLHFSPPPAAACDNGASSRPSPAALLDAPQVRLRGALVRGPR